MSILNLFKVALRAIASNKFRSFLSMLGIIIGVAAVIIMMAIGQGSKESVRANIAQMGTNVIMIRPGAEMRGGVRQDPSAMQTLKQKDYELIEKNKKYVTYVSPEVTSSGQAIYGANNTTTSMYGEGIDYLRIKLWDIQDGDYFTEEDIKKSAKVCVVGKTIVDELFPDGSDPVGKTIRFKSIPMRIVGVLKSKGYNSWGMDQDNVMIAPYTTVMKRILAQTYYSSINCSAITEELTDDAIDELTATLRESHEIKSEDVDDFTIRSQQEMMETMSSTMDTITIILVVAAAFSLLVAGIGIMNIMLVSVTERTKEIGLRMSVGARGIDISNQFLIESVLISITGGILGILIGWLGTLLCAQFGLPASIPLWSIFVSFAVCTVIGIGLFPCTESRTDGPYRGNPLRIIAFNRKSRKNMKANALLTALAFMIILGVIKSKESSILASFFPPATSIRCFSFYNHTFSTNRAWKSNPFIIILLILSSNICRRVGSFDFFRFLSRLIGFRGYIRSIFSFRFESCHHLLRFGLPFLYFRFLLCGSFRAFRFWSFLKRDSHHATGVISFHGVYNRFNHVFQFVNEDLGIVCSLFYFSQLLFPNSCQFRTFQQFLMNDANELNSCRCRDNPLSFPFYISPFEKGFNNCSSG